MTWREFRRKNGKAFLYWKIKQEGETYTTEHGQIGTANPQTFSDTPGPKGKENTKAYVSAVDNCTFHMEREIRKKQEHGYIEYVDGKPVTEEVTSLDFNKCLPKNFCGYKPQTDIKPAVLQKIHDAGNACYSRKYDGMMHLSVKHPWGWEIYTRRMDLSSDRFPKHIEYLDTLGFEAGTILTGEMVCQSNNKDDFKSISRICRSDPPEARKLVEDGECPEPTYFVFDILYHNGISLQGKTFAERQQICSNAIDDVSSLIKKVHLYDLTPDTWEEYAKREGWEGFVVVDKTSIPGEKFFSFDGDAKRPKGHHKLKPTNTEDVVIYAGVKGSGKRLNTVGSVLVKQIHPETGEWFRCGKVGSGFTDEDIAQIEKDLNDHNLPLFDKEKEDVEELNDDGIVTVIEYSERQPDTNKFRFPVFIRTRTDKLPRECVSQRLAPEAE